MSHKEILSYLKHAKIDQSVLRKICFCFAKDYTAIETAKEVNLSRQTINNYYKIFRNLLLRQEDEMIAVKKSAYLSNDSFLIKCIKHGSYVQYFVESNNKAIVLDEENEVLPNLQTFIKEQIHSPLQNNRRVNTAKVLFNKNENKYILLSLTNNHEKVQHFIQTRLKKFRGLNHETLSLHLKESQYRYNYSKEQLYDTLISLVNLKKARLVEC